MKAGVGAAIMQVRQHKGLGRGALAKLAGIKEDTLRQIERGKTGASLGMLKRIADALGVTTSTLLASDLAAISQASAATSAPIAPQQSADLPGLRPLPSPPPQPVRLTVPGDAWRGLITARADRQMQRTPEYWLLQGDVVAGKGQWRQALQNYEQAEALMERKDYSWARVQLERAGQMLINLNAFDALDERIAAVQQTYQQLQVDRFGQEDPQILMLIEEKRAWKHTWRGETEDAVLHARAAIRLSEVVGDETIVEETGLHFSGRALCEKFTTYMLYPRLFTSLSLTPRAQAQLSEAANFLTRVEEVEKKYAQKRNAFNEQWKARVFRALGSLYDARTEQRKWREFFGADEAAAEAKLDLAKLMLIDNSGERLGGMLDAEELVREIRESFRTWQYAPGLAETATTEAYIMLNAGHYSTPHDRARAVDLCLASLILHPFPLHPNYKVAQRLLVIYAKQMDDGEYLGYQANIEARLGAREPPFDLLKHAFALDIQVLPNLMEILQSARNYTAL